jgi:hypothetical protein
MQTSSSSESQSTDPATTAAKRRANPLLDRLLAHRSQNHGRLRLGLIENLLQLKELWALDNAAYGDASLGFEQFHEMWRAFPSGLQVLYFEDVIVGAMGVWPLKAASARAFKDGQLKESAITREDFCTRANRPDATWYISGIVLKEELRGAGLSTSLLMPLAMRAWLNIPVQFPCEVLAIASSDDGIWLLPNRFGLERLREPGEMADGFPLYGRRYLTEGVLVASLSARGVQL